MEQAARILAVAALEAALAAWLDTPWLRWPLALLALHTFLVGVAVGTGRTEVLGKSAEGRQALWAWVPFAPWLLLTRILATLVRQTGPAFTEVEPGWWVGGWPHRADLFDRWPAVLDLTCELPRRHQAEPYLCLPTWDQTPPSLEALQRGARFLADQRRAGRPVLVHCAAGRGRSVTVLCAGLVEAGRFESWEAAYAAVKAKRPAARLTRGQRAALRRWDRARRG